MLWYSPALFLRPYLAGVGITQEEMRATMGKSRALDFLMNLVVAAALLWVLRETQVNTILAALGTATILWAGFVATVEIVSIGYERCRPALVAIGAFFHLVGVLFMAVVLTHMT